MPQNFENVIKVISKFFDPKLASNLKFVKKDKIMEIQSIDDILKLPINAYKFFEESDAKYLEEFLNIHDIGDVAKLKEPKDRENFEEKIKVLKEKYPRVGSALEKAITISSLIVSIKKESEPIEKKHQKLVVVGLDNAGKTAILTKFGGKLGIGALSNLKPTKGLKREVIEDSDLELFIWDMGGQKQYREKYLKNPDQYFLQIDLLIYVIDVQDSARFEETFEYFEKIIDILIKLEEKPYILVFLHKYDPDLAKDPTILLNIEFLKENLKDLFSRINYELEYEIYLTSIYSLISSEPKFSKYLKEVMKGHSLSDPTVKKVDGLGNIIEDTLNVVVKLSESISLQLSAIEHRLAALESGAILAASAGEAVEIQTADNKLPRENVRSNVLTELKDLFAKKKKLDI